MQQGMPFKISLETHEIFLSYTLDPFSLEKLDGKDRAMHFFLSPFPPMVSKNLAASRVVGLF